MSCSQFLNSEEIAIVGAGVAGMASLIEIVSNPILSQAINKILIFDRNDPGRSIPYSHESTKLLMNTSIGANSIVSDDLKHFYRWLVTHRVSWQLSYPDLKKINLKSFVPRRLYGDYLADMFQKTVAQAVENNIEVACISEHVSQIKSKGRKQIIYSKSGEQYLVDYVIMATGKEPLAKLTYSNLINTPRYFAEPYVSTEQYRKISSSSRVLIVGSRLSAIDAVRLLKEQGFSGQIEIASRSGIFPAVRSEFMENPELRVSYQQYPCLTSLTSGFSQLLEQREAINLSEDLKTSLDNNAAWQKHIVPFVFRANELWHQQKKEDQLLFKRLYDMHLSRFISAYPEEVATEIVKDYEQKKLHVTAGLERVTYDNMADIYVASYKKNGHRTTKEFDCVINATCLGKEAPSETRALFESHQEFEADRNYRLLSNPQIYLAGLAASKNEAVINAVFLIVPQVKSMISGLTKSVVYNNEYEENNYSRVYSTN